ncbi:MAG: KOW domain-containing RNA-binding protein [Lachnoclostridium sp.]|nr:KOW domain-containing RNA-binding protein [Lachnospira sp.]MCM1247347.1 KOW domain-containing RNA-binding protein [Lachnoclostridium sp.]
MEFKIGNFVISKAGHDKGQYYVIVGEEGDFVYLSDGRLKKVEAPKRKRKKHIQIINRTVGNELLKKLTGTAASAQITDEEIKYEIKQYLKQE